MMQYVHFLRNINNQTTAICQQIIRVYILQFNTSVTILFFTTRHRYVFFCKCNAQNLVCNWYGSMEDCLPFYSIFEIFHSIPFWHLPYSIPKFPFHSNFHSIPCHVCRFYLIIIIVTFYRNVVASLKIRKRLILKKLLPLPAPFQPFCFRVCFRFQPLPSKCFHFRFHKKLTASTASASTSLFKT